MAFEELKDNVEDIQKQAQFYIENSVAYYKLWGFKVAAKSVTMIFKFALIAVLLSMVLFFCSIAGAFAIGKALDNNALGFLIIAGIYLVFTGLLFLIKDKVFEGPILEKLSEIFFKN